jgi:hypothetical protein
VATDGVYPRPQRGHGRIPVDQLVGLEPAEPSAQPAQPAAGVGGESGGRDHPGGLVGVAGRDRVLDGLLGEAVVLAPAGRPPGQLHRQGGILVLEPAAEQLAEQPVEPVPLPAPVQGRRQQIRPRQGLEQVGGPGRGQHGVA